MDPWNLYMEEHQAQYLEEMLEFLRIPSISSLPEHSEDVKRAADWVAGRLQSAGMENVRILATGGHPVVYGDWCQAPGKPTIMILPLSKGKMPLMSLKRSYSYAATAGK